MQNFLRQSSSNFLSIFSAHWVKNTPQRKFILWLIFILWLVIVLFTMSQHEFWRDEVRDLSIAKASGGLGELFSLTRNEGHTFIWYWLLHLLYKITGSNLVLPLLSIAFAGLGVALILFWSPFSLLIKFLFVFSILPLYEYAVMARTYGISMFLIFAFALLYRNRQNYAIGIALILALLANTNLHALILAGIFTGLWIYDEFIVNIKSLTKKRFWLLGFLSFFILIAAGYSMIWLKPDGNSLARIVLPPYIWNGFLEPIKVILISPWNTLGELMVPTQWVGPVLPCLIFFLLVMGLSTQISLLVAFLMAFISFTLFFNYGFWGALRHQGLLFIFLLALYWILLDLPNRLQNKGKFLTWLTAFAFSCVLPALLIWHIYISSIYVKQDMLYSVSSVKALAQFIDQNPKYRNAIIVAEPEYIIEALPYYLPNRIYIPRESVYRNWGTFMLPRDVSMSLGQLEKIMLELKSRENVPVLLVFNSHLEQLKPADKQGIPYRQLIWSSEELASFKLNTNFIQSFWLSVGDENFDLYEVK